MREGITEALARRAAARPRRTLAAWAGLVVVALALVATSLHGLTSNGTVTGHPSSATAKALYEEGFPGPRVSDLVVVHSGRYTVGSPAYRGYVTRLVRAIHATGGVAAIDSYLTGTAPVSLDRHATVVELAIRSDGAAKPVVKAVRAANGDGFTAAITGDHTVNTDFGTLSQTDLEHGEFEIGLPAALVVLVLVFASLVAGLVPVLMAILSIVVGLGIVALLSLEFSLSVFIVNMLTGMGLALGIDYSLFVISRYREERGGGLAKDAAIRAAGATASRAVLFSGSTFVVALFGMLIVPTSIMRSLAAGAIIVGVVSVAAALTLLPALLSLVGDRVNALRVPFLGRNLERANTAEGRVWRRIVDVVLRRPALSLVLAAGLMVAAASPTLGIHIGQNGVLTLPSNLPSRQGYVALRRYFGTTTPYPVVVVARGGGAATTRRLETIARDLRGNPHFGAATVRSGRDGIVALRAPVLGQAAGEPAVGAVRKLTRLVSSTFSGSGTSAYVGGTTAESAEYYDATTSPTPYVLAFVLGLSLILLTIAFRSLVVALVSIALNLLSVGAAYGLLTLVFIHGWLTSVLGFEKVPIIDAWVPLFLFSVLFALSMDYQVFLMSRIRERYDASGSTRDAVAWGVASTARIITGAALIIVAVFSGFASGQLVMFQQMGFGVAVALLLDATLIRSVVLPSMMSLLGERAWYLPGWLEWLPHLDVERHPPAPALEG
ncbi:MAG TPA: MMPL family transporter [Gaiellaceae bacterium]|nr:MMPL family transporter [Gaiellaceae bacterium]